MLQEMLDIIGSLPEDLQPGNPLPRVLPLYTSKWSDARAATPEEITTWLEGINQRCYGRIASDIIMIQ